MDEEDVITNGVDQVGGQKDTSFNLHKSELHNGGQNKTIGNATVVQRSARDKKGSADKSSPRRHECKECGKAFKFKKCLDTHLKVHAGLKPEKPYSCGICGMKFFSKNVLQKHTRNKHPDEFPCRKCGKIFNVEDEMKIHTLSHSKIKPFQCGFCNEGYSECSELLKHLLSHTVDSSPSRRSNPKHKIKKIVTRTRPRRKVSSRLKSNSSLSIKHENEESENSENENPSPDDSDYAPEYETSDQDKKYDVQPQELKNSASTRLRNGTIDEIDTIIKDKVQLMLSRNVKVDLKKERIVCEVCGKDYSVRGYQNHVRTHSGNRKLKEIPKFYCHQCDKWFTQKHALRKHYQRHLGRRYKCEYCNKSYCDSYNLTYHMKIHTGGAKFSCSYCDRLFCSKSQLSYHITVHTGVKAFTCEICGRDFRLKTMLKTHIKTHTQDRPYMCDICGRKFLFMASLRKHSMVHTGEKPHGCSICGKTFAAKVSLAQHMNIHTGEGYPCPLCGRQFAQLANLTRHKRIHTGSRPYPCTLCDKTFRTSNDKKRHMRIHTGDKPYHCDICGKGFTQSGNLQTHMKVHNKGADNRSHNTSMNSMAVNTQNIPQHQINNTL